MALIEIDGATFKSTMQGSLRQLGEIGKAGAAAVTIAMVEYAQKLLDQMKARAPHKTYHLIQSGHINGPRNEGDYTVVEIEWDAPYAMIQDVGGTITPKDFRSTFTPSGLRGKGGRFISKARQGQARLFVPLRPGVLPIRDPSQRLAAGYKYGIDYVFAQYVKIPGNRYISDVLYGAVSTFAGGSQSEGASAVGGSTGGLANAARDIGARAEQIWKSMVGNG